MIRFFHVSDIHFGVENYGRIDPATGIHTRLLDFKKSLDTCIEQAIEQEVDFFLFTGDAYKTSHPTPTQQRLLIDSFLQLQKAQIPVIIIVGNHDHPLSFGKANALDVFGQLPVNGFHVFSKPETFILETKKGPVQIVGIPWPTRNAVASLDAHRFKTAAEITNYISERVSGIITNLASELNPAIPAVLAGHLTVTSGVFSGSEKTAVFGTDPLFLPSQLAIKPFDYVALGHLHRYQNLNEGGYPAVVYAGSVERVDFGERKEPKGYVAVEINEAATDIRTTHTFVELPARPMIQIDLDVVAGKSQTEQILAELEKINITDAIIKIVYRLPDGVADNVDLLAIQRATSKAMYVTGIIPVKTIVTRERRTQLSVSMDLTTMLSRYFDAKAVSELTRSELLQKAAELKSEVEEPEEPRL